MTCIFVCFTCFLSQQIAQNLSSKNPEPSRHTIRGYNFQHLNLNLRPKRIAQYTSENNGARIARWAVFNYVRTLFRWSGRPESLQTKSRETSAQNLDGQALLLYSHMCSLSSPKAGSPKFLKIDSRPTNEKTIAEQPSRTVSVSAFPLPPQVIQNFCRPICAADTKNVPKKQPSRTYCHMASSSFSKQVAQDF